SERLEDDRLSALPEAHLAEIGKRFAPFDDRQEVVAGELSYFACEADAAIGEQDLSLTDAARINDDLARRRKARVVLIIDAELRVAQGNPAALAAPADMDDTLAIRQNFLESSAGQRCLFEFEAGLIGERPGL